MLNYLSKLRWSYIRNNLPSACFLLIFTTFSVILFVTRMIEYSDFGLYVMLARANGQCLNFTCSFILVCVLRKSITYLRSIGGSAYLPLDHNIYYHKLAGWAICFYSAFHTIMHVVNFHKLSSLTTISVYDFLFTTDLGIGWIGGTACITGWILVAILVVMMIPAQNFMRRSGQFEVFYYTHLLYIAFFICLFIHAPSFWIWFAVPFFVFTVEAMIRKVRSSKGDCGRTYIEQGVILPSKVIQLIIKRPINFDFHPGDYVFVQIPAITKYEWHPLTISSSPEQGEIIWLHIRAVGEWTNRLYDYFLEQEEKMIEKNIEKTIMETFARGNSLSPKTNSSFCQLKRTYSFHDHARVMVLPIPDECNEYGCGSLAIKEKERQDSEDIEMAIAEKTPMKGKSAITTYKPVRSPFAKDVVIQNAIHLEKPLRICLDGPYGSPSSHIFNTQHAVLIATGIGVTPFASILQSIMRRYIEARRTCPTCLNSWSDPIPPNVMKLRKVDFVWINRDQKSFEWFVNLLNDLESQQMELGEDERFLDIHLYFTGKKERSASRENEENHNDMIEINASKSDENEFVKKFRPAIHVGRPNWIGFLEGMGQVKKGKITVFYCGRNDLARFLRLSCNRMGFLFRKEVF